MRSLICSSCGASNSEFDSRCVNCDAPLPKPSEATLVDGGRYRKDPPRSVAIGEDDDDDEFRPGQEISHFRILGRLGKGGMGKVYRALDLSLDRVVALKFLLERRKRDLARLEREAKALAKLDHPNIGTIYDFQDCDGLRFIVMALYDGETLAKRLARWPDHRLSIPEAAAIISQLANALQAAHAANLVHRDLKPENVVILPDGRVKLIDFGLARWPESARLTLAGHVVGTLDYMAPEQFDEDKETGPAADLWALGVVLYEMIAGRHPFEGKGMGRAQAIINEKPFPLRKAYPEVPAALERIVEGCLAKEPEERWSGAGDILNEIEESGLLGSAPLPPRRGAWRPLMAIMTIVLLFSFSASLYYIHRQISQPVYVAVLQPEVSGLNAADKALVTANIKASLMRTVTKLDGLSNENVNVNGDMVTVARALGAGNVVTSRADCAGNLCQVSLSRWDGNSGGLLWRADLPQKLSPSQPRHFADAVATSLRGCYRDRKLRVPHLPLEIGEEDYRSYLELHRRSIDPKAYKDVLDQLDALRLRSPAFLDAYALEAYLDLQLFKTSDHATSYLDQGIKIAEQAEKLAPRDPRHLDNLFDLYEETSLYREAEAVLKKLAEVDPAGSLERGYKLADRQGDKDRALSLLAEATWLHPTWRYVLTLANAEYKQGQLDNARRHFDDVVRRVPDSFEGLMGLAQTELLRNPERAIELLRKATAIDPGSDSQTNTGFLFLLLHQYEDAEKILRKAVARNPGNPSANLNLADSLLHLKSTEAQQIYSLIIEETESTNSGDWQTLSVRAQALAHLGQKAKADETIRAALHIAPDNTQLFYEAALAYALVDNPNIALAYAKRAAAGGVAPYYFQSPFLEPLRHNPEFQKLAKPPD